MPLPSNEAAGVFEDNRERSNFASNLSKKGPKSGLDSLLGVFGFSAGDSDDPAAEDSSATLPVPPPSAGISLSNHQFSNAEPFWVGLQQELTSINTEPGDEGLMLPSGAMPVVPEDEDPVVPEDPVCPVDSLVLSAEIRAMPVVPEEDEDKGHDLLQDPTGPPGQYYKGQVQDRMKHGKGVLHYYVAEKGRLVYEGEFVQNKKHGEGVLKWGSGQQYMGKFLNDDFHGQGTMTWPNGNQYMGQYANGKKDGIGTCFFPDGSKYYGQFKEGKRHGEITRVKADGSTQLLHFAMDKLEKAERITSEGGDTHRSLFSDCTTEVRSSTSRSTHESCTTEVRSSVSKSTHASSVCSSSTSNGTPKSKCLQKWRVVHQHGATVRSTDSFFSKKIGTVRKGEEMTVAEIKGHQMLIVSPFQGWVSARTKGWTNHKLIAARIDKEIVEQ